MGQDLAETPFRLVAAGTRRLGTRLPDDKGPPPGPRKSAWSKKPRLTPARHKRSRGPSRQSCLLRALHPQSYYGPNLRKARKTGLSVPTMTQKLLKISELPDPHGSNTVATP